MKLNDITTNFRNTSKMPVLFLGHGSPMNAIAENEFVQGFRNISSEIQKPKAIIVVSAHWETRGTKVTTAETPATIHDFAGFPGALYKIQYPAPGMPKLAKEVIEISKKSTVEADDKWGLDHGAWSVIRHMYSDADVPVIQVSLDYYKTPQEHYEFAHDLNKLREKGVLIIGSGNIVHNLRMLDWKKINENYGYDWANETNRIIKQYVTDGNHLGLANYSKLGKEFELAVPTPEHFLPLLYVLALQEKNEEIKFFNDNTVGGAVSMTSLKIG